MNVKERVMEILGRNQKERTEEFFFTFPEGITPVAGAIKGREELLDSCEAFLKGRFNGDSFNRLAENIIRVLGGSVERTKHGYKAESIPVVDKDSGRTLLFRRVVDPQEHLNFASIVVETIKEGQAYLHFEDVSREALDDKKMVDFDRPVVLKETLIFGESMMIPIERPYLNVDEIAFPELPAVDSFIAGELPLKPLIETSSLKGRPTSIERVKEICWRAVVVSK